MNNNHEIMAAERALRGIAEMKGVGYVHFAWYADISKFGVSIHNDYMVRSGMADRLDDAVSQAIDSEPFDATPKVERMA